MKKLNITKEQYKESEYAKKYGNLKYVSESSTGRLFKTDKGQILKFVAEAREYVDDDSIEVDSADEFIIFDDPDIFNKIANVQKQECEKVQDEVKDGEVTAQDVANAADKAANKSAMATIATGVASSAINSATQLATSKAALGVAAAIGYKKVLDKAGEVGEEVGSKVGDAYSDMMGYNANINAGVEAYKDYKDMVAKTGKDFAEYAKISNLGQDTSTKGIRMDKQAMYYAKQLKSGEAIRGGRANNYVSPEDAKKWLTDNGYEINKDGIVNKVANVGTAGAVGAAGAGGAASATGASAGGWTLFGMSAATVGWIVAGVAAAAVITPYIYDKVRACTKTWMADIIAEVKFKADGKNYRCFYDLKKNKWVLTYADIKWTSYLDNKLDQETKDEFFASKFFQDFLEKCKRTFALLFSTGKNEVVFKALPEIKDAPKELKSILEKIYDNKGAITKNMFTGNHE